MEDGGQAGREPGAGTAGRPRRVVLVGSSGGNLHSQGGDDPAGLLAEVRRQLDAAGIELVDAQFVAASSSMDGAGQDTPASLWSVAGGTPTVLAQGTLASVNEAAARAGATVAAAVGRGEVDGLVLVSADPEGANREVIEAAVAAGLPAAGTGGTSIAAAQSMGLNLVAVSGTTGTTNRTRAVAYAAGLAKHWELKYRPVIGGDPAGGQAEAGSPWRRISIRGIMSGSLPAFIALALTLAVSKIPGFDFMTPVFDSLIAGLPIVVAAMAARRVSGLADVGVIAGIVAGILGSEGGILGGLLGGILAGVAASYLLAVTLARRFPSTTASIVAGGISGLAAGLVIRFGLAPVTAALGEAVKTGVQGLVDFNPLLAGAAAGLVMWPAIIAGIYHSAVLPLVLLEMGEKGHSFFGAVDMTSLVMVSLGITVANILVPRASSERALAVSGAAVNFGFGTFVEASYPFIFADRKVFAAALVSACAGGAVVGVTGAEGTAYVPSVVAPFVSTNALGQVLAMLVGFGSACALTLLANTHARRTARAEDAERAVAA